MVLKLHKGLLKINQKKHIAQLRSINYRNKYLIIKYFLIPL
jgi:hypothetical protein